MELIEIKDLTYTYPGASVPTLRHMNLTVERGDFLAIIGNNGCGKSTLCKTMNGLIPHFISGEMEGKVFIDGVDTCEMDVGSIAKRWVTSTRILRIRLFAPQCWTTLPMPV